MTKPRHSAWRSAALAAIALLAPAMIGARASGTFAPQAQHQTQAAVEAPFAVVVHPSNTYEESDPEKARSQFRAMFLKSRKSWPSGADTKPFGRVSDSKEAEAFRQFVLMLSAAELADHWIDLKQKTGETPPRDVPSGDLLLKFLEKFPEGFGVMSAEEAKAAGSAVRAVYWFGTP